jgi:uncharacterized protein YjbJ (UPF0337 family)
VTDRSTADDGAVASGDGGWPRLRTDPGSHSAVSNSFQEIIMTINKDQVKGAVKDIAGKIQEEAGKLVGSKEQEAKGLQHQLEGKVQKGVGDVKEAVSELKTAVKKG